MIRRILCIVAAILFLPAVAGSRAEESGKEGAEIVVNGTAFQDQRSSRDQHRVFYEIFVAEYKEKFAAAIIAVAHRQFREMEIDFDQLLEKNHVIYDVKAIMPRELVDGRL